MNTRDETSQKINLKELFLISNLFSLFRILIIPALWYFVSQPDENSANIALSILVLAGISDGLDGYLARKLNQVSRIGLVLDPLADKILAGALVIMLIFYREFPIWLAALIIGRDLLILIAAALMFKGKKIVVPSTITGKYAFFYIVALLSCSIIRYDFGVAVLKLHTTLLIIASLFIYSRKFTRAKDEIELYSFKDNLFFKIMRIGLTAMIMLGLLIVLYTQR